MKEELDTLKKEREVAPRQRTAKVQSVADTAPNERPLKVKLSPTYISSRTEITLRSCNRKDCSERTKFLLAGWADGILRRPQRPSVHLFGFLDPIFLWN